MNVPKIINFSDLEVRQNFGHKTKEYDAMMKINGEDNWKDYCNEMLSVGISCRYDVMTDMFIILPIKMGLKENQELMNIDIETPNDELLQSKEQDDTSEKETETMKVVSLEDVLKIIQTVIPSNNKPKAAIETDDLALSNDLPGMNGEPAICPDYSGILNNDFSSVDDGMDLLVEDSVEDEEAELLLDDEELNNYDEEVVEEEMPSLEVEEEIEEEMPDVPYESEVPAISMDRKVNCYGMPVQIVLTGVMITAKEIDFIAESVKKNNNILKSITGVGNELNIIVEANNKKYTINYVDAPLNSTKTPFSIKDIKFKNLNEALNKINSRNIVNEKRFFNRLLDKDLIDRQLTNTVETDILSEFKDIKVIPTWTVGNAGVLDLKSGLNETFSNITATGNEKNTLVKSETGDYYLLKGNLKERTGLGTKKELVDLRHKKSYGVITVEGLYENTEKGLGDLMFKTRRTSIPLLVWK